MIPLNKPQDMCTYDRHIHAERLHVYNDDIKHFRTLTLQMILEILFLV